jgi:hypothetical protein
MELRAIPNYRLYMASDDGRIWSVRKKQFLNQRKRKDGYMQVTLCEGGERHVEYVHRLIASAFVDNPNGLNVVNHMDEDRSNNVPSNLEWCTYQHNSTWGNCQKKKRETVGLEKLQELARAASVKRRRKVKNLDTGVVYESLASACRDTGLSHSGISSACSGRYKQCGGHRWAYA